MKHQTRESQSVSKFRRGHRSMIPWQLSLILCLLGCVMAAKAQAPQSYSSPEDAMKDLVATAKAKDNAGLNRIFGADMKRLASGDPVQQTAELDDFNTRAGEKTEIVKESDAEATIEIGDEEWPFPVPLVKTGDKWAFDTPKGVNEILKRRIGRNELSAIALSAAYAVAQWDYFVDGDWNNDGIQEFAQKFVSSSGQKDGLYWPTSGGEASPLGPLVEVLRAEGYSSRDSAAKARPTAYHGYMMKLLKAQGPKAPGGAYNYVINGHMIGGFAMVAYPAVYGQSGVMTFIVNQQGKVYQKNLGPRTAQIAQAMTAYNPGPGWTIVDYQEALDTVTAGN